MKILAKVFMLTVMFFCTLFPSFTSISVNHQPKHYSIVESSSSRTIQNEKIIIYFNRDNEVYKIITKHDNINILKNKIIIDMLKDYEVISNSDDMITFQNNNDTITIKLKDYTLTINGTYISDTVRQIEIITPKEPMNNSTMIGYIKDNEHVYLQRNKDAGFLPSLPDDSNTNCKLAEFDVVKYRNSTQRKFGDKGDSRVKHNASQMIAINGTHEYVYRETLSTIFAVCPNSQFARVYTNICSAGDVHTIIQFPSSMDNVTITVLPNEAEVLKSQNMSSIRTYGFLSLVSSKLSWLLDKCMEITNNSILGFILYIIFVSLIVSGTTIMEVNRERNIVRMNAEIEQIQAEGHHVDTYEAECAKIKKKYDNGGIMNTILSLLTPIIQASTTIYAIPYCYALNKINFLWMNLAAVDRFKLIPIQSSWGYLFSPLVVFSVAFGLYRMIRAETSSDYFRYSVEIILGIYMALTFSAANILFSLWMLMFKDIVIYVWNKYVS